MIFFVPYCTFQEIIQQAALSQPDGYDNSEFGNSISLSGTILLVGAPNMNYLGINQVGLAFIFVQNGGIWSEQQLLSRGQLPKLQASKLQIDIGTIERETILPNLVIPHTLLP